MPMLAVTLGAPPKCSINSPSLELTMKGADSNAAAKTIANLPVDLKKYHANQLLGHISAQANALLETATSQ